MSGPKYNQDAITAMLAVTAVIKDYEKASTSVMAFGVFYDITITTGTNSLGNVRPGGLQDAQCMLNAYSAGVQANHATAHWVYDEYSKFKKSLQRTWEPMELLEHAFHHMESFRERFLRHNIKVYEKMRKIHKEAANNIRNFQFLPFRQDDYVLLQWG